MLEDRSSRRLSVGGWWSRLAVTVCTGVLLLGVSGVASAGAIWRIASTTNTTAVAGGTIQYGVELDNDGDSPTPAGVPYTVQATLGAGLTGVSVDTSRTSGVWDCSVTASVITCTETGGDPVFRTGAGVTLPMTVAVAPGTSGVVTSSFVVSGGGAASASTVDPTRISPNPPSFGLDAFDGQVSSDALGDPFTQAGGHPYAASTSIDFNTIRNPNPFIGSLWPVEPTKDLTVDLPPGFLGNPAGLGQCTVVELANGAFDPKPLCPPDSQVGTTFVRSNLSGGFVVQQVPVFNLVPPVDVPARFGFNVFGTIVTLNARVRSDSDYGVSVDVSDISEGLAIAGASLTLWGTPADPSHDIDRACPGLTSPGGGGPTCSSGTAAAPFLRNPTRCTPPGVGLPTSAHIDSWAHPGDFVTGSFVSHLPPGYPAPPSDWGAPQGPTGCDQVPFEPTLSASPTGPARAGTPSAFTFDLTLPQVDEENSIGESDMKKTVVHLPAGVRVSPSSADGLQGCSPAQIGLIGTGFPEPNPIHFNLNDPACPDASKIGSLTIETPLLSKPLTGSIYLATPNDNPFHSLIAVYLVAKGSGVIVKFPGKVDINQSTGQLTATFDNAPQTPISRLQAQFDGGPRAPLVLPRECGTYTTHAELTSWSGQTVSSDSRFDVSADGHGAPCPTSGFAPGFTGGTLNPSAGKFSPFLLQLTRAEQDQELNSLTVDTPTGLLGKIASTVLCSDAAANAGTCGDGSRVGSVTVGAGAGSNPFYISTGRAYITGPYRGAPYGLSIVVPAVAGPFDLGNVIVRSRILVDKTTAQLKVVSDPLPTILQGIPLDVRDIRVAIDRPSFTLNPTSCVEKHVLATVGSTQGAVAHLSDRFEAANCANLALAPKLSLTVGARKHTRAGVSTPVTATLTMPPGDTNLRSTSVTLPASLNALLPVVNQACKLAEFEAGHCGDRAKIGTAVAVTPLLRDPLRGSVFFVKNPKRVLPDLMVALRGQVALDVTAKVSIPGGKRLGTRFDTIPDAPITKFTLRIVSGKNGPVGIATNLCSAKGRAAAASVGFRGQNGKVLQLSQRPHIAGCPKAAKARKAKR